MKKHLFLLAAIGMLCSCDDFLDVKPQSEIEKEVLFSTEYGFFEALNGVYVKATENSLYGNELTFGTLDVLAQNYTFINEDVENFRYVYGEAAKYNFENEDFISNRNGIWYGLYNAVGNCNLILENLEENKEVFTDEKYAKIIKGEALGLRAYFHFDLLRMFAPSFLANPSAPAIPYVTAFDKDPSPQLTVDEVLNKVITDLLEARLLLADSDPVISGDYTVGYTYNDDNDGMPDDGSNEEIDPNLFLQSRRHRMNYYGVCASLARVYIYKNDKAKALEYALEVIESNKFPWTAKEDFTADDELEKDRILYKELIFGWFIPTMEDDLRERFEDFHRGTSIIASEGKALFELAGPGAEDFRYKEWLKEDGDALSNKLLVTKYKRVPNETNLHHLMAPAIRLSEMYYIAAESIFESNPEQAWEYFNTVRFHRGIGTEIKNEPSREVFIKELLKEARKEFYAEGQIFYMYKRLNQSIVGQSGINYGPSNAIFVLPLPDNEILFGIKE